MRFMNECDKSAVNGQSDSCKGLSLLRALEQAAWWPMEKC